MAHSRLCNGVDQRTPIYIFERKRNQQGKYLKRKTPNDFLFHFGSLSITSQARESLLAANC
jgi:hypothetical protein